MQMRFALRADMPSPDPSLTKAVQDMIDDYHTASHICLTLVAGSGTFPWTMEGSYLEQARHHLETVKTILYADMTP